jgi:hypothetical protein
MRVSVFRRLQAPCVENYDSRVEKEAIRGLFLPYNRALVEIEGAGLLPASFNLAPEVNHLRGFLTTARADRRSEEGLRRRQ